MYLQVKETMKLDLFTTLGKPFFGSYHHPQGRDLFSAAKGMD